MTDGVDQTPSIHPEGATASLPPLSIPEAWPNKPGVRFFFDLTDPPPEPGNAIERAYATGLANLRNQGGALAALEHFRAVVTQDIHGSYSSARLLALVLRPRWETLRPSRRSFNRA
jgi:hypothetical protein